MTAGTRATEPDADRRDLLRAWLVGLVAALLVVGPGLGPGAWLNLDLVVTDVTPVPRGTWALGPELPRRVPFALPFAWLSALVPGELPWKLAVVAALAAATAGTWRLVTRWAPTSSPWVRAGAALLAGVGPFASTRMGAGHLGMTFALAVLPWAVPALLAPTASVARTVMWGLALGATGPFGGTLALPALLCGLVGDRAWGRDRRRRGLAAAAGVLVAQGPWLVPTIVVAAQGTDVGSAGDFPTSSEGAGGVLRLLLGHGFWRPLSQVGGAQGWEVPLAGLVLAGLAAVGWRRLPAEVRLPVALVAVVGLVGAAASALPGVDGVWSAVVDVPPFAALREGQRVLALWIAVAAPAAAVGADALARRRPGATGTVALVVPLVLAVLGLGPALWGIGGALDPVDLPAGWSEVRAEVRRHPGPVMVVPWAAYPPLAATGGRPVAQPFPVYLGGDVLVSSDPGFGDGSRERSDAREGRAAALAARMTADEEVAADLADLGIRWVVEVRFEGRRLGAVPADPGLREVVRTADVSLHEVAGWAPGRDGDGDPVPVDRPISPVIRTADGPVTVAAPGSDGWRRAGAASTGRDGLLALPEGPGTAWYPGAVAALLADAAAVVLAVSCGWRIRRLRRSGT